VWARTGYTARVNGEVPALDTVPGTYVTLSRSWSPGDRIEIEMPFSFRVERTIDDPMVVSLYYGPTLLAVQAEPVGEDLASGLIEVSDLYGYLKLDGDLAPAMTPTDRPLHFALGNLAFAPFFVADPADASAPPPEEPEGGPPEGRGRRGVPTQPYHMYLRRREPRVVFGSVDAGVPNAAPAGGLTFLDTVWDLAPFADHAAFVATVERVAGEWQAAGTFTAAQGSAVGDAARRAEADLRV